MNIYEQIQQYKFFKTLTSKSVIWVLILSFFIFAVLAVILFFMLGILNYYVYKVVKYKFITSDYKISGYGKTTQDALNVYGDIPIKKIYLVRKDLMYVRWLSCLMSSINNKRPQNLYHIQLLCELEDNIHNTPFIMVEKNEGIYVSKCFSISKNMDMMTVWEQKKPTENKQETTSESSTTQDDADDSAKDLDDTGETNPHYTTTLNKMMNNTKNRMGDCDFYNWNNLSTNNCQTFTTHMLEGLNAHTDKTGKFMNQQLDNIMSDLGKHLIEYCVFVYSFFY